MKRAAPAVFFLLTIALSAVLLSGCLPFSQIGGYGSIWVTSTPEQASIWLDGQDTGLKTNAVLEHVSAGRHKVELRFPGMEPVSAEVVVKRSQQAKIPFTLHPIGTSPGAAGQGAVHGFVLENVVGSPVEGATVRAYHSGTTSVAAVAVTDADGAYGFNLPPGTYDIVASKDGHAGAKRQALAVAAGDDHVADIILKEVLDTSKSAEAPTLSVTYDRGDGVYLPFEPGIVVTGLVPMRVKVDSAHPVTLIGVWVSHRDQPFREARNAPEIDFVLGAQVSGVPLEPVGENELIVQAYDLQQSWVEVRIPFVRSGSVPAVPPRVTGVDLTAVTYGTDIGLSRQESSFGVELPGRSGRSDTVVLKDGTVVNLTSPKHDVTLYVIVKWNHVPSAHAYEIERAWSKGGPWRRIARLSALLYDGSDERPFLDMSADLYPGLETFYRVRAVGPGDQHGEWSTPVSVTPLERFEVRLVSPEDGATGVSLNPVFRWEYDDVGAEDYLFAGYVLGYTSSGFTWEFQDLNITEARFNYDGWAVELLKPAKTYVWTIDFARAYSYYGVNSRAIAIAGANGAAVGAANGAFTFTTGYDE